MQFSWCVRQVWLKSRESTGSICWGKKLSHHKHQLHVQRFVNSLFALMYSYTPYT
uniref:Uncharacterized protein n=1 Tax=Anguilla anguilla TaxID=7936 RepID=A0A0E9XPU6_ANGAN